MRHARKPRRDAKPADSKKKRLILGFMDQGIVSATGLLTFVAAAQFLSADDLGYFSFGVATCLLVVSLARAICGEPLLVRSVASLNGRPSVFRDTRSVLGLAILLGLLAGALCAGIGMLWSSPSMPLLAAALAAPGLVLQDTLRFCFIALQRTRSLLLNDSATLVLGACSIIISGALTSDSFVMLASWGLTSLAVSLVTLAGNALVPSISQSIAWLKLTWKSSSAFFTESAMGALAGYTVVVILTVFVAPAEVAAFRATLVVYGVASLVINFLRTQVLRELRLDMINSVRGLALTSAKLAVPVVVTILSMLIVLMLLPSWIGEALLQDTWASVAILLIPGATNRFFASLSIVPTVTLRVQGITWKATVIKIAILTLSLGLGPLGALYAGAAGALYADSISYALAAIFLFAVSFRKARGMAG
jgi:O-antigen/teichoic acid export membrane protein